MPMYSDTTIERVKEANDIVDVIGRYVALQKSGSRYKGLCPFHHEKTPSFIVTPELQMFKCFGCQKGGSVFTFVQEIEKVDFPTAIEMLAEWGKIDIQQENKGAQQPHDNKQKIIYEINTEAAKFYYTHLKHCAPAIEYIRRRGLTLETVKTYGLGAAPDEWDTLYKHLHEKGYKDDDIIASKLINAKYYDAFRNRLMFPIIDHRGRIIGFGGRVYDNSLPKYINSSETQVYNKGQNLYGLNIAKKFCADEIILVEGYMDVISLHQHGVKNIVAALGTALTEKQARLLSRYTKKLYLCYDSDQAGQKATMRALEIIGKTNLDVRIIVVPGSKDPDEYIKKNGRERFELLMQNALSPTDYLVKRLESSIDIKTSAGRVELLNGISSILSGISSDVEKEFYARKYSSVYGVNYEGFLRDSFTRRKAASFEKEEMPKEIRFEEKGTARLQRMLIGLICTRHEVYDSLKTRLKDEYFAAEYAEMLRKVKTKLEAGEELSADMVINGCSESECSAFADAVYSLEGISDADKAASDIINKIELGYLEQKKAEISEKMSNPEISSEQKKDLGIELAKITMEIVAVKK